MGILDFESYSITKALLVLLIAAVLVWMAGSKLSRLADNLAEQTGIGRAFIGLLLLGGITSLPEVATSISAAVAGNAGMAVSNVLGGVSMQVTILAVVDAWQRQQPLSSSTSTVVVMLQGVLLILMLALTGVFMQVSSVNIFHIGINSIAIFSFFLLSLYFVHRINGRAWLSYYSADRNHLKNTIGHLQNRLQLVPDKEKGEDKMPVTHYLKEHGVALGLMSLIILAAGYFVVKTSEVIGEQTGLSANFAGLVLVAVTTSLPEISTTIGAVKLKRYDMAFSNIFGTNLFDVSLIFLIDVFYIQGPVLAALDRFAVIATLLGIVLTAVFLVGIISRSQKQVARLGYDSLLALITYILGVLLLYHIKS